MSHAIAEKIKAAGVVGAGGGGFPTHVKAQSQVEYVLVNGAECEPLIHKDVELMMRDSTPVLRGLQAMMTATGATKGIIKARDDEVGISIAISIKRQL